MHIAQKLKAKVELGKGEEEVGIWTKERRGGIPYSGEYDGEVLDAALLGIAALGIVPKRFHPNNYKLANQQVFLSFSGISKSGATPFVERTTPENSTS